MQFDSEDYMIIWFLGVGLVLTAIGLYVLYRFYRKSQASLSQNKE